MGSRQTPKMPVGAVLCDALDVLPPSPPIISCLSEIQVSLDTCIFTRCAWQCGLDMDALS